jgi:uncharacterized protein (TIGR01777 family)
MLRTMVRAGQSQAPEPVAISKACVFGASGLIGGALVASLRRDKVEVVEFGRSQSGVRAHWNPAKGEIDRDALIGADAVINLAGARLDGGRWTAARKRELWTSRVGSTALLARTLADLPVRPEVLVNASAVGFYGDRGQEMVDERSGPGAGYLPELCQAWETATSAASEAGIRVVHLRTGVVLTPHDGALRKLLVPFRLGLGGPLGGGAQGMPWIALDDAINVIRFAISQRTLRGPVNVVAPEPVSNDELSRTLADVVGRPSALRVPRFALKALLGEMADEVLLSGALVRPRVLEEAGFRFDHPRLHDALETMLHRSPPLPDAHSTAS